MTYYKEAFKNLLDDFAKKVKEKQYNKLDYDLWRRIYTVARETEKVVIEHKTQSSIIKISWNVKHSDGQYQKHWVNLESNDGSLGRYLADELYNSNLQPKVNELGTITFDTCYFGESTANKSILSYDSLDLDSVRAKCNNELRLDISPSGIGIAYGNSEPDPLATMSDLSITRTRVEELGKMVEDYVNKDNIIKERKENEKMKGFNFDFGSCEGSNVRMSMYGMAVKNASGIWVAYDKENEQIMDVDILNFEGSKYMYKMPVALKDVAKGDVVIHNRRPMFVTGVASGKITAIDPFEGEEKVVLLTKSPFGFDFATKVVCLFDGAFGKADAANPFGNMLPFLMMGDSDIDPMMLMAMSGGMDMSNPMMMYFLMKDGSNSDLLPLMLMGGFGKACNCHCDCDKED